MAIFKCVYEYRCISRPSKRTRSGPLADVKSDPFAHTHVSYRPRALVAAPERALWDCPMGLPTGLPGPQACGYRVR